MNLRPLVHADLAPARELLAGALEHDRVAVVAEEKLFGSNGARAGTALGAWDGARLDGVLALAGRWIKLLAVAPERRGHGVGTRLLDAARAHAGGKLRVGDHPGNYLSPGMDLRYAAGRAFFERRGLAVVGEVENIRAPILDGENPLVTEMRARDLAARAATRGYRIIRAALPAATHNNSPATCAAADHAAPHNNSPATSADPDRAAPHNNSPATSADPDRAAPHNNSPATSADPDRAAPHGSAGPAAPHNNSARGGGMDRPVLLGWISQAFAPVWAHEVARALDGPRAAVHVALHNNVPVAFAAADGNNQGLGWFGPAGTDAAHRGRGLGEALLLACLLDVRGLPDGGVIAWIGPKEFYRRSCGAVDDRRFVQLEAPTT